MDLSGDDGSGRGRDAAVDMKVRMDGHGVDCEVRLDKALDAEFVIVAVLILKLVLPM